MVSFLLHVPRELGARGMKIENFILPSVSFIGNFCAGIKWGVCSDGNIQLCRISARLRLVNSGEESIRLLTDSNGKDEQSEQKPNYFIGAHLIHK